MRTLQFIVISLLLGMFAASARAMTADTVYMYTSDVLRPQTAVMPAWPDTTSLALFNAANRHAPINIYRMPYSLDASSPDWHRMWINTAVLSGAFVSTLFVLECLPEDATSWNRAAIQSVPPFKRWFRNVFKRGPEWDHDNPIFNYVLHPYAGAAYFMSARTQGFNFWQSMLYSACISTIGWEFGIEAFMERPSYQDIVVTPVVGSIIGELFYRLKRNIVSHDYRLAGSPVLGNIVVFLIDPVNEVLGLFRGNNARKLHLGQDKQGYGIESSLMPGPVGNGFGFTFSCRF
ncbi:MULTISPECIES: DUF3943 domain-containing protein [Muribaculaceae]|jgi:hypothetical protein|nr:MULTISPECIES: DUF3943 domain-containing protein [Muribaculaceae]MDE6928875.1 DUF3943 domain-containing protein [Muribaculaceae bacterium]